MSDTPETPLGSYIDHTNLRPDATAADIEKLCAEAIEHQLFAVCVNGSWVQHAATYLEDADVSIATVIGFPLAQVIRTQSVTKPKPPWTTAYTRSIW